MVDNSLIGQRWAKVLGRGGVSAVSVATGVSRTTIMVGLGEIEAMQSRDDTTKPPQRIAETSACQNKNTLLRNMVLIFLG